MLYLDIKIMKYFHSIDLLSSDKFCASNLAFWNRENPEKKGRFEEIIGYSKRLCGKANSMEKSQEAEGVLFLLCIRYDLTEEKLMHLPPLYHCISSIV